MAIWTKSMVRLPRTDKKLVRVEADPQSMFDIEFKQ